MTEIMKKLADQLLEGGIPLKAKEDAEAFPVYPTHSVYKAVQRIHERTQEPFAYLEFGTWLGDSALVAATASDRCTVICVDTWLGSAEHWIHFPGFWGRKALNLIHGMPTLYERFRDNVQQFKEADKILPLRMSVQTSAHIFTCHLFDRVPIKVILVDAAHDKESVIHDLRCAEAILKRRGGGLIIGHDWPWDSVKEAVKEVFGTDTPELDEGEIYFMHEVVV